MVYPSNKASPLAPVMGRHGKRLGCGISSRSGGSVSGNFGVGLWRGRLPEGVRRAGALAEAGGVGPYCSRLLSATVALELKFADALRGCPRRDALFGLVGQPTTPNSYLEA